MLAFMQKSEVRFGGTRQHSFMCPRALMDAILCPKITKKTQSFIFTGAAALAVAVVHAVLSAVRHLQATIPGLVDTGD